MEVDAVSNDTTLELPDKERWRRVPWRVVGAVLGRGGLWVVLPVAPVPPIPLVVPAAPVTPVTPVFPDGRAVLGRLRARRVLIAAVI